MNGKIDNGAVLAGRYVVDSQIGEGGMQYVYKAYDQTLCKFIALKTPKDSSAEKRFIRSAQSAAKVNHPNVAKTLDYFEEGDQKFLVEELIFGADLSASLLAHVEAADPYITAHIFHHIARGLAASHHAGVIHRDLKPTNIMVSGGLKLEAIKITDFGIAKLAEREFEEAIDGGEESIGNSKTVLGALPYMAPEGIEDKNRISMASDIWSLGAMMHEIITGEKPFGAGLKAIPQILKGSRGAYPAFLFSNNQFRGANTEVTSVIDQCLRLDPADRPTADELVSACSNLCYPETQRILGRLRDKRYKWGFIAENPTNRDVFYHSDSFYGTPPVEGDEVWFAKYPSQMGADRAHPVIKLK
ncbi:serine/threonine-protein kinase [Marinobacter nauticus]|uniref:non-specific serine/threonine protein kinase n=1 Tax=Marinobacter nauticus TaxID=2743 RepID=A0A368XN77_MARNT|nr:serine/threonine-protein kinase [Marinobacter nauticus]RCW68478.1 serine/threonine-protein kinase [Marinobacter nauticus]